MASLSVIVAFPGQTYLLFGQNVGADLDPNCLSLMVYLNYFFEKVHLKKNADDKKHE